MSFLCQKTIKPSQGVRVKIRGYAKFKICDILNVREVPESGGFPFVLRRDGSLRSYGGMAMITYADFIQFCIFVVALVSLCHQIFKDRK